MLLAKKKRERKKEKNCRKAINILPKHDSEREHVALVIVRGGDHDFGGHVQGRADGERVGVLGAVDGVLALGQPKVADLGHVDVSQGLDKHVLALEVAVDDLALVQVQHRLRHLVHQVRLLIELEIDPLRLAEQRVVQASRVDELGDDG